MTSNQPPTMPTAFQYSAWRHGGWYVNNVRYPSGAIGCVSRNYADGKWRIACDPRPFDQQPTFKSRDDAARAEWLLANAPEPVAGAESTDAVADNLATLAKGVCEATAARLRGIAETGTALLTLELASAIRSHARAERDIELGKLPSTADWLTVQRFAEVEVDSEQVRDDDALATLAKADGYTVEIQFVAGGQPVRAIDPDGAPVGNWHASEVEALASAWRSRTGVGVQSAGVGVQSKAWGPSSPWPMEMGEDGPIVDMFQPGDEA